MEGSARRLRLLALVAAVLGLGACAQTKIAVHAAKEITKAISPAEQPEAAEGAPGAYKIGEPYEVAGVWYYPKADPDYDETGIASWYGEPFHGRDTANGETYDMNAITAAHKTLPMPSYVRVTNLENGRALTVRVNDRGPFVHGRVIDLSRRGAQLLGFERSGTARVRVQAVGGPGGETVVARVETPEEERTAVAAAPRVAVASEPLAPPAGLSAEPLQRISAGEGAAGPARTATRADGGRRPIEAGAAPVVTVVPVRPTQLFVQAGAFSYYDNARRLGTKLSTIGPTLISRATVKGQRFYRVRIGPLASVELADATLEKVIDSGYPAARIVVD